MSSDIKCMYPRRVNPDIIQCLPLVRYAGKIDLVETDEALDVALSELSKERILGFDTETRPNFTKGRQYPVSILQLGGESKVWVIRLDPLVARLKDIYAVLENPSIKKAGIAVQGDIKALKARCPFNPAGFVDVAYSTTKIGVINTGMRNLAALLLGERMSKAAQLTNWASEVLDDKQLIYAATDAWMSRRLFLSVKQVMEENRFELEPEAVSEPRHFSLRGFIKNIISRGIKKIKSVAKSEKTSAKKRRNRGNRRSVSKRKLSGRGNIE